MNGDELSYVVLGVAIRLHRRLGPGLMESVYEELLAAGLRREGLGVEQQKSVGFEFEGCVFERGLRIDLLVEGRLVIELKSVEQTARVHARQLLTYLRLMNLPLGLLLNFGAETMREGITRVVNNHTP